MKKFIVFSALCLLSGIGHSAKAQTWDTIKTYYTVAGFTMTKIELKPHVEKPARPAIAHKRSMPEGRILPADTPIIAKSSVTVPPETKHGGMNEFTAAVTSPYFFQNSGTGSIYVTVNTAPAPIAEEQVKTGLTLGSEGGESVNDIPPEPMDTLVVMSDSFALMMNDCFGNDDQLETRVAAHDFNPREKYRGRDNRKFNRRTFTNCQGVHLFWEYMHQKGILNDTGVNMLNTDDAIVLAKRRPDGKWQAWFTEKKHVMSMHDEEFNQVVRFFYPTKVPVEEDQSEFFFVEAKKKVSSRQLRQTSRLH